MSSSYSNARLEEETENRIKQELAENIKLLKDELRAEYPNLSYTENGSNIELSVFAEDSSANGCIKNIKVDGSMLQENNNLINREDKDLSGLLLTDTQLGQGRLELELASWIKKIDERPVISETDEKDRDRVTNELSEIKETSTINIEDKVKMVKMRVESYLQGATIISENDKEIYQSEYYEYCALCKLINIQPKERIPYRIRKEITRIKQLIEKSRNDEYIMNVIEEIMDELGCHVKGDAVLARTYGELYSVDGHSMCDVFVGRDGNGIMFEPIGATKDVSLEKQRKIEASANSICLLYDTLEKKAAERGVILERVYSVPSEIEQMCVSSDVNVVKEVNKQRKVKEKGMKTLKVEE